MYLNLIIIIGVIPLLASMYTFKARLNIIQLLLLSLVIILIYTVPSFPSETLKLTILFFLLFFSFYYSEKTPLFAGMYSSLIFINTEIIRFITTPVGLFDTNSIIIPMIIDSILGSFIAVFLTVFERRVISFIDKKNSKLNILLLILCMFLFFQLLKRKYLIELTTFTSAIDSNRLIDQVFLTLFFFLIIVVLLTQKSEVMRLESESKKAIYENQLAYLKSIEKNAEEVRKFKHDYQNILLSMDSYFREDKYEDLKKYYYTQIKHSSESLNVVNDQLNKLMRIQSMALRSILYVKLSIIDSEKVNLTLEIDKKFFVEEKNEIPLVRSLGIILDNAVDALEELEQGSLQIALIENDGSNLIIVKNSCVDNLPPLYQLEEKGFSTKGANRGIGLSNLKEIMEETDFLLETEIVDHYFIQKIIF